MATNDSLLAFARGKNLGAVVALKKNGRPQLSMINYAMHPDEPIVRISTTADRAKTHNIRRDPRVSLFVFSDDGWQYAVLEGDAELSPVAENPHDATVEALIDVYRQISGEHPDWDDYRRAMVADQRLVLTLHVTHTYGATAGG
jgi:PPOX class probable F420-dependent enzyme